jgi:hypothetical protein
MMADKKEKPSRWQAKVWKDTVLSWIVKGDWFTDQWADDRRRYEANALQIEQYFPGFGGAYAAWKRNPNGFNEQVLKQEAEKVILALPLPYEQPDIQHKMDAAEEEIIELRAEVERLSDLLSKSVRVEEAEFVGERGCRFILGEDHVVAEWRGDGIASDTVFSERPALEYGVTTTPYIRCMRMAFEMAHWEILCAMVSGPGDGYLREEGNINYERKEIVRYLKYLAADRYRLQYALSKEIERIADTIEQEGYVEDLDYEKNIV